MRSTGPNTGEKNVALAREDARHVGAERLDAAPNEREKKAACSQPMIVMSAPFLESFGTQHRVRQVRERGDREHEADEQIEHSYLVASDDVAVQRPETHGREREEDEFQQHRAHRPRCAGMRATRRPAPSETSGQIAMSTNIQIIDSIVLTNGAERHPPIGQTFRPNQAMSLPGPPGLKRWEPRRRSQAYACANLVASEGTLSLSPTSRAPSLAHETVPARTVRPRELTNISAAVRDHGGVGTVRCRELR